MQDNLDKIKEALHVRLATAHLVADEILPEWLNTHDYSSGYHIGRKQASVELIKFLKDIIDRLDKL